ncbi:MAG: bifunctional 2-polyprenyl-6-hydroxyphenol methylase/3-demethylubiquinol 3-O-methyltransferase UbiG [Alphaproteobacteria bacterium]|nr:bifunctional 2-polyprenyl-6-hydroxyphenol methylase/3-demethylubiquinol 3-O-methyltransferase UbiG [Alphaproteobacteria bacterium]
MKPSPPADLDEVARFDALGDAWWDPLGPMAPLHKLNPARLRFIRDRLCAHCKRDAAADRPLRGLKLLDIGCGGGILAEPLARLGAQVTAIDAAAEAIAAARKHAQAAGLNIDYRATTADRLLAAGMEFDAVCTLEVVEHVPDRDAFLAEAGALVKPGGALIAGTLNRTTKAFLLAIVGAEYLLRWLPRGTHDFRRFVRPDELERGLAAGGITVTDWSGVVYDPLTDRWKLDPSDLDVNYLAFGVRPKR